MIVLFAILLFCYGGNAFNCESVYRACLNQRCIPKTYCFSPKCPMIVCSSSAFEIEDDDYYDQGSADNGIISKVNSCQDISCPTNSECQMTGDSPVCICPTGFSGQPETGCNPATPTPTSTTKTTITNQVYHIMIEDYN